MIRKQWLQAALNNYAVTKDTFQGVTLACHKRQTEICHDANITEGAGGFPHNSHGTISVWGGLSVIWYHLTPESRYIRFLVHYAISLSLLSRFTSKHCKMLVWYIWSILCLRLSHYHCVTSKPIFFLMITGIYVFHLIINIESKTLFISHWLWLGSETMVSAAVLLDFRGHMVSSQVIGVI